MGRLWGRGLGEHLRLSSEITGIREILINGREAEVRDAIYEPKPVEDGHTDLLTGDFGSLEPKFLFDLHRNGFQLLRRQWQILRCRPKPGENLRPLERRPLTTPLDHGQR